MEILKFSEFITEQQTIEERRSVKAFVNALSKKKDVREFDYLKTQMDPDSPEDERRLIDRASELVDKYKKDIQKALSDFAGLLRGYTSSAKFRGTAEVFYGTKPVKSIVDKTFARGRSFADLGDLIRGAILFDTNEQVDQFIKDFRRKDKDKIINFEAKEKGGDPTYGYYGSYHIDVDVGGYRAELQVMTKRMWKMKGAAHEIYTATRSLDSVPQYLRQNSREIFRLANKPAYVREQIENVGHQQLLENIVEIMLIEVLQQVQEEIDMDIV